MIYSSAIDNHMFCILKFVFINVFICISFLLSVMTTIRHFLLVPGNRAGTAEHLAADVHKEPDLTAIQHFYQISNQLCNFAFRGSSL